MALPQVTGKIDPVLGYVVPNNSSTWAALTSSTWALFTSWVGQPADPLVWNSDTVDLGSVIDFTLQVSANYTGSIGYTVLVSDTGDFLGEETSTVISEGDVDIAAFRGRYVIVSASVSRGSGLNTLISLEISANRRRFDILLNDLQTTDLAGDVEGRTLVLGRTVSKVLAVNLSGRNTVGDGYVKEGYITIGYFNNSEDEYLEADYVLSGYVRPVSSQMSWPMVVSKDRTGPVIVIRDSDGAYIDGEFDAQIHVLPEQYMENGQLLTR